MRTLHSKTFLAVPACDESSWTSRIRISDTSIHRRLLRPLSIALHSAASLLTACGGGGSSSNTAGLGRYDSPSAQDVSFGEAGYRVFSTGLPARAYLGAFNPNVESRAKLSHR